MKSFTDKLLSFILLILMGPFIIFISITIFLIDGTGPFFIQIRIGRNRIPFRIIKFKTMSDEKPTKLGHILRSTGIDELPQLINILKNEMSFVGPRPLTPMDIKRLGWDTESHDRRWTVKPGITGPSQLLKLCDPDMSWEQDEYYSNNVSILLDIRVLAATAKVIMSGKKPLKKSESG